MMLIVLSVVSHGGSDDIEALVADNVILVCQWMHMASEAGLWEDAHICNSYLCNFQGFLYVFCTHQQLQSYSLHHLALLLVCSCVCSITSPRTHQQAYVR